MLSMPEVNQREVYYLPFPFGSENGEDHPYIVISTKSSNAKEQTFLAVMITASAKNDDYTFSVQDNMFEKPLLKAKCQVRMHLIVFALYENVDHQKYKIGKPVTAMKKFYFEQLMKSIGLLIFDCDIKLL
jgi:mRNA-degrading endonuclease toxin of MazEF toxin-antitoxin module